MILGAIVYVFFRPNETPIGVFLRFINPNDIYIDIYFIRILPDFLSVYSVNSLFIIFIGKNYKFWTVLAIFFTAILFEFFQYFFSWGTFDYYDIVLYLIGCLFSVFFLRWDMIMKLFKP